MVDKNKPSRHYRIGEEPMPELHEIEQPTDEELEKALAEKAVIIERILRGEE